MKTLKIGICGWGNVATGLFKAIEKNSNLIQLNGGVNLTIDVIGARRDNPQCNPGKTKIERDIFDVIKHDIDVVVELIGGVEVARELIIKAMYFVASSDGHLDKKEGELLMKTANVLEMTSAHVKGVLSELDKKNNN